MRRPRVLNTDTPVVVQVTDDGGVDDDGVPTSSTVRVPWPGVNIQRLTTTELVDQGRNTTEVVYRVAGDPPPVTIEPTDLIEWLGDTYSIDGEPDVRTGRGRINYTSLTMSRVEG